VFNNPVILREVVTHLRNPGTLWQLGVFMLASSIVICVFWTITLEQMQHSIATNFTREMFMVLNLFFGSFILLLVPLQSAAAINLEKERDSWDLLISTNISLGSIVFGKLVSSLTYIWLIAISLLPMYAILIPLGGIAPKEILFVFAMMTEGSLLVAVLGLTCSIYCKRVISSITATYMIGVGFFFGSFLFSLYLRQELRLEFLSSWLMASNPVFPYVHFFDGSTPFGTSDFVGRHPYAAHGMMYIGMMALMLLFSFWRLSKRDGVRSWEDWINDWIDRREKTRLQKSANTIALPMRLLPDYKNPVAVKERRGIQGRHRVRSWMTTIGLFILPLIVLPLFRNERMYFWFVYALAPILVPLMVLPYACNAVRGERDRSTWDLLSTTTLTTHQLLWGKFFAGLRQFEVRLWSYLVFPTFVIFWMGFFGQFPDQFEFDDIGCIVLTCYAVGVFYLALGIYLSCACRKTLTAYAIGFGVAILAYFIIPLMILVVVQTFMRGIQENIWVFWAAVSSPWIAAMAHINPPRGRGEEYYVVLILQCGGLLWAAYVLYLKARDRLARLSERRDEG